MRGTVMYGPGDVRVEERDEPRLVEATDAVIRVSAACVCGSDLWPYRGVEELSWPAPMGHEYVGIVEEVGTEVETIKPGQFVVGSFWGSDNTCEICRAGYQSACVNRVPMGSLGAQAERLRIPFSDGTLVATPEIPSDDLIPSLVSASDVRGIRSSEGISGVATRVPSEKGMRSRSACAPSEPMGTRLTLALWYPARQISQVLSEPQNEPTTNWPGLIVSTSVPTSSTIPTYS